MGNNKRKKGALDAKRGKIFTKIGRELMVAVKEGGPDPDSNSKLRDVIAKAKANNMPNDNIQRSIKKASGEGSTSEYFEMVYEGYGPSGIAVMVETLTDNKTEQPVIFVITSTRTAVTSVRTDALALCSTARV